MLKMKQKAEAYIRMKTTGTTIVLIVLALLLSGCAADSTLIDEQKNLVVSCLNDHDLDELHALMYPNAISKEELEAGYLAIEDVWQTVDVKDVTLIQLNSQTNTRQNQRVKVYRGVFRFPEAMEQYALYLLYMETGDAKGLTNIRIISASQAASPTTPLSLTISRIVTVCFIIFSIVDVVRKKPRRYGWYIVLCIVVFWFNFNHVRYIVLPLGALIYWCIRKKLLTRKAAMKVKETENEPTNEHDEARKDSDT